MELSLESQTGIELFNPFYDCERGDIQRIDKGELDRFAVDFRTVVENDCSRITESQGVLAILCNKEMIGTYMELMFAKMTNKPVYALDMIGASSHPWVKYCTLHFFYDWGDVKKWLKTLSLNTSTTYGKVIR
jgi:hypothetical protein